MKLTQWKFDRVDLDNQQAYVENPAMSVLANAVELLNIRLLDKLQGTVRVLEIGCGAYSLVRNLMEPPAKWEGIDVIEVDSKGNPSVATKRASVEEIPWPAGSFDIVLSNQSIEHWYEYGVTLERGLSEIRRVLKPDGRAYINFPIHLHGQRMFVEGDFPKIDASFTRAGLEIESRIAVEKSSMSPYRGWRLCGFPDFIVNSSKSAENTSYVVEYVARPFGTDRRVSSWTPKPTLRTWQRHWQYGIRYLVWKVLTRLRRR
jgi:SAM-dependent methyltransferase